MIEKLMDIKMHISENLLCYYVVMIVIALILYLVLHSKIAKWVKKEIENILSSGLPGVNERMKKEISESGIEKNIYDMYHYFTKGSTYGVLAMVCLVSLLVDYLEKGNSNALVVTVITCIISFMECYDNMVAAYKNRKQYLEVARMLTEKNLEHIENAIVEMNKPIIEEFEALSDFDKVMRVLRNRPNYKKRVVVKLEKDIVFDTWIEVKEKSFLMIDIPKDVKYIPQKLHRYNATYFYDSEKAVINIKQSEQIIWLYFARNKEWD